MPFPAILFLPGMMGNPEKKERKRRKERKGKNEKRKPKKERNHKGQRSNPPSPILVVEKRKKRGVEKSRGETLSLKQMTKPPFSLPCCWFNAMDDCNQAHMFPVLWLRFLYAIDRVSVVKRKKDNKKLFSVPKSFSVGIFVFRKRRKGKEDEVAAQALANNRANPPTLHFVK